jgi:hypothetical protein
VHHDENRGGKKVLFIFFPQSVPLGRKIKRKIKRTKNEGRGGRLET